MKRVLITGMGSYLGSHLEKFMNEQPEAFQVTVMDVSDEDWKRRNFSCFDSVVHVAGIAHQMETLENAKQYFQVNCELATDVAQKAKAEGVKQFVLFSTMSVYGLTQGRITPFTSVKPKTYYGKSKFQAEQNIVPLGDENFHVAILRPPMIYGKGCKGNYPKLSQLLQRLPAFPKVRNQRSMLYVDRCSSFVGSLVASGEGGLFFPQNKEYVSTDALALEIAKAHGKHLWQPGGFGWVLRFLARCSRVISKVFGSLTYDMDMSRAFPDPEELSFAETIRRTEEGA